MQPSIIFEDSQLLVIDKPSGWIVNEAKSAKGNILQTWLSRLSYPLAGSRLFRSGIVHRLDKETSGVLIVAKTEDAFSKLQAEFKERKVEKTYLALLHGKLSPKEGGVNAPIARLPWRRDRFGVVAGGREAATKYKVTGIYERGGSSYSLIEAFPKTGRTHQIRVHFKYLGHPLVADEFYAGRKTSRADRLWCPRLFLHAQEIRFIHPESLKPVVFTSPLAIELKKALGSLKKIG